MHAPGAMRQAPYPYRLPVSCVWTRVVSSCRFRDVPVRFLIAVKKGDKHKLACDAFCDAGLKIKANEAQITPPRDHGAGLHGSPTASAERSDDDNVETMGDVKRHIDFHSAGWSGQLEQVSTAAKQMGLSDEDAQTVGDARKHRPLPAHPAQRRRRGAQRLDRLRQLLDCRRTDLFAFATTDIFKVIGMAAPPLDAPDVLGH